MVLQHVDLVMYTHQKNWDLLPGAVGDRQICSLTQTVQLPKELSQHHRQSLMPNVSEMLLWESAFLFLWQCSCFWDNLIDLTRKQRSLFQPTLENMTLQTLSCLVPSRLIVMTLDGLVLKYHFSWPAHSVSIFHARDTFYFLSFSKDFFLCEVFFKQNWPSSFM